jgi:DNA-binding response OmpR family regulator
MLLSKLHSKTYKEVKMIKKRILWIDYDPLCVQHVVEEVKEAGFEVTFIDSLDKMPTKSHQNFDLLIVETLTPGADVLFLAHVRAWAYHRAGLPPDIPIFAYTAEVDDPIVLETELYARYFPKPFRILENIQELLD